MTAILFDSIKQVNLWAVDVAQLVERLLATPEVHSSNHVISKLYIEQCLLSAVLKGRK